ncbi:MAG: DUF1684 domain-containing protein [Chloroflexi bacterium]|nr:DUF1684 domain-containing protein [Chloroflexota bacterium]
MKVVAPRTTLPEGEGATVYTRPPVVTSAYLELLDWRRRVAAIFAEVRRRPPDADTLQWFRAQKDDLFKNHPQSPLPVDERARFGGLPYWPFDPAARVVAHFLPDEHEVPQGAPAEVAFHRIGTLTFELHQQHLELPALWIDGYAGGLFVPFKDATSGSLTYGGGRYLLDTIKSADLGSSADDATVILDFNYAYHPSCAYDPVWVCPLAPPDSRLSIPVEAGEQSR